MNSLIIILIALIIIYILFSIFTKLTKFVMIAGMAILVILLVFTTISTIDFTTPENETQEEFINITLIGNETNITLENLSEDILEPLPTNNQEETS